MPQDLPTLGKLEMATLDHLWEVGASDAKSVHGVLGRARGISLNTVQSALERLHRKGLLDREKVSHAYVYRPAIERSALMARMVGQVIDSMTGDRRDPLLSAFVDAAERVDEASLERLERAVAARRAAIRRARDTSES